MSIYTKKGDKGETGLLGGSRISKASLRVSCYGTLDEANAAIGVAYSLIKDTYLKEILRSIQKHLFVLGAELASDEKSIHELKEKVEKQDIDRLEEIIDQIEKKLGPITEFIIPGNTTASAQLHFSRSVIRRAERHIVDLNKESIVRPELIKYVNRLSDTLFMIARAESHLDFVGKIKEKVMEKMTASKQPFHALTLDFSIKMAIAAEQKAHEIGVPIVFSVVDGGGNLVLLHRMQGALLGSLDISQNKAYTSVALKMTTDKVASLIQPGAELYGLQGTNKNRIVPFGGGFPLKLGDEVVGGIGVSGGSVEEDMMIAQEALHVFNQRGDLS
ncbi:cob(I)yrinic acid a,c-diamide adenosyltransferase [Salipaludibacillus daqingensis]|uniref:cob(I)yrinic acid a,c-diamide adenosyltransferase n=1 Tax=Salipaludibacillus daqingensis TaxID=3041001 RepID=UPI002475E439|nr:cob(I)yrinic acid a,c-diamide adenosyltransferase [Salipaludibacillus daqingensis]